MKVISIKQPFASLIAEGLKEYEFRTWKTNYRGKLLIHASKTKDKEALKRFEKYNLDYKFGCIIAEVNLTDCIKIDDDFRKILKDKNPLVYKNVINKTGTEKYAFKIENVKKILPIYVNGKLGLWNYECEEK